MEAGALTLVTLTGLEVDHNVLAITTVGQSIFCINAQANIHDNLAWMNEDDTAIGGCREWASSNGNIVADPLFCGAETGDFSVSKYSPALLHKEGGIGAYLQPGCERVAIVHTTWGGVKSLFVK